MKSVAKQKTTGMDTNINAFIAQITAIYKIDSENLTELWMDINNTPVKQVVDNSKRTCSYIFTKGAREKETCGCIVRGVGGTFCSRHRKYEGVEPKEKKNVT